MSCEVGTVKRISRVGLAVAGALCGLGMLGPGWGLGVVLIPSNAAVHLIASYGLSLMSFAAFPRTRRTDLVKVVILMATLAQAAHALMGRGFDGVNLAADIAGAFAVLAPSFMETFRSLIRMDPHEPFSMVYPGDRRRRSRRIEDTVRGSVTASSYSATFDDNMQPGQSATTGGPGS